MSGQERVITPALFFRILSIFTMIGGYPYNFLKIIVFTGIFNFFPLGS
jgi:hypothetical protein